MKKIIYVLLGISTFLFGVLSFYLRPVATPISLCEATKNADVYQFFDIRIKAKFYVGEEGGSFQAFDFKKGCSDASAALILVDENNELLHNEKISKELLELVKEMRGKFTSFETPPITEVEIRGKLINKPLGCYTPPYTILVKEIKQVSPIKISTQEEILDGEN